MRLLLASLLLALHACAGAPALAHEAHGVNYSSWTNRAGEGCCNNQDCRAAADEEVQLSPVVKVKVGDDWCPVLEKHYLRTGNAPDWSSSHVCISNNPHRKGCDRLLCFQPKPLF